MKAILSGLALSTAVFAAHAEPPVVDKEAQTITWAVAGLGNNSSNISKAHVTSQQTLNCRFGTLSHRTNSYEGGVAMVDLVLPSNHARLSNARETCKRAGLTAEF